MDNIILIGFMGAGKTTVGKFLARDSGMRFLDTDDQIVSWQKMSIPDIFSAYGEEYFRNLETELLRNMQDNTKHAVISVGGGMPVREENRVLLRKLGCVVYLSASKETILSRVGRDGSRPMLNGEDLEKRVEQLMRDREALYRQAAHVEVKTDGRSVYQVEQIIRQESRRFL